MWPSLVAAFTAMIEFYFVSCGFAVRVGPAAGAQVDRLDHGDRAGGRGLFPTLKAANRIRNLRLYRSEGRYRRASLGLPPVFATSARSSIETLSILKTLCRGGVGRGRVRTLRRTAAGGERKLPDVLMTTVGSMGLTAGFV